MSISTMQPVRLSRPTRPAYRKVQRAFFAVCLILGPLVLILSVAFNPARSVVNGTGSAVIAATALAVHSGSTLLELVIAVVGVVLLPFGLLGMTLLAMRRAPWLASIGCLVGLSGLMAFMAFVAQSDLTNQMALLGGGQQFALLWDRFNTDPLMTVYLYMVILGMFLIGPLLLAIGLGRGHLIPAWAVWVLILRAPVQIVGFLTHIGLSIELVTFGLLLIGSIPVALALLKFSDEEASVHAGEQQASSL
jgi:hypothetical protein